MLKWPSFARVGELAEVLVEDDLGPQRSQSITGVCTTWSGSQARPG